MEEQESPIVNTEELQSTITPESEDIAISEGADQETTETAPQNEAVENSLVQLKRFTEEDEDLNAATKTLRSILGGDFLTASFVRSQLLLIVLIFGFFFAHITLRYVNQKELVEIDRLKKQLDDSRFNTLTRFSELTAKSRQTYIEEFLKQHNDSTLQTATQPPYIIHLNGEKGKQPVSGELDSTKQIYPEAEVSVENGTVE